MAVKAPVLGGKQEVSLEEAVFGAEVKPHLVHEAVRAELNAQRQGTRAAKSRGLVSGGRSKPWRQKGTGRARHLGALAPREPGRARGGAGEGRMSLHPSEVLIRPVISEKSYEQIARNQYTFRVHKDAHKTQVRQAVEQLFDVKVERVNIVKVQPKPKRRGMFKGTKPGWKKAIVQLRKGDSIEIFEGAQL